MKKVFFRNIVIVVFGLLGLTGIILGVELAFYSPSPLNNFIALKVYEDPANTAFKDQNFYNCVVDAYNKKNGTSVAYTQSLTDEQLKTITSLTCSGNNKTDSEKIIDTSGLNKLINLTNLRLESNKITSIDVSKNTALTDLYVYSNKLTELDVSKNTSLRYLRVSSNQLIELDVRKNVALVDLEVSYNKLTELDVSKNIALTKLYVYENQLTKLDVSKNTALKTLWVYNNRLTELDVSKNIALTHLLVYKNQLTELDVSKNITLTYLSVYGNQLTELDVSKNIALTELLASNNELVELDISRNTALTELSVFSNQLTELDVSKNTALVDLQVSSNKLTELDVSKNTSLETLNVGYNELTELDVSKNIALTGLQVPGTSNQLTKLDVSKNLALEHLRVDYSQLTELDVSKNVALRSLYAIGSQLTKLDVSKNIALRTLYVYDSQLMELTFGQNTALGDVRIYNSKLTNLDVTGCTSLTTLYANDNQLTKLTLGQNTVLTDLRIYDNKLTELDVSQNTALKYLFVWSNQLTKLGVSKNVALTNLDVHNNQLTEIDVSKNLALTSLSVNNNKLKGLDVTKNTLLRELRIWANQLTKLDVSKNTALTDLYVYGNQLTKLDVSKNTALKYLYVYSNQLTELNVSKNTALTDLRVYANSFQKDIGIYLGEVTTLNFSSPVILFGKKTNKVSKISNSDSIVTKDDTILGTKTGVYPISVTYKHDVQISNNTYEVTGNLYVIEATSEKYTINNKDGYIYVGNDVDSNTILNNIDLNYGTKEIVNNELIIKYENKVMKTFKIVNATSKEYDLSKDYIYTGISKFDKSKVATTNGTLVVEDNTLKVKYNDEELDSFKLVSINSNEYDLSKDYIYTGISEIDKTKINITHGNLMVENNTLKIKYNDIVLDEYEIASIQFKKMMVYKDVLLIAEDMSYQDFIANVVANGVTYKIFSDDKELNSGIISDGVTLRVYKNNEVLDEYDILVEFLDLSLLSVREDKLLIKDLALGTKVSELKSKILTSGIVKVLDKNNKELKDDDIVKTGIKVNIYLSGSGRTFEYTLSVKGDITGTGTSTVSDVAKLYQYLRGKIKMDYCYIDAGNVVGDEVEIKVNDVAKLYQFIKGKISSLR